jgi:hypothetical protein
MDILQIAGVQERYIPVRYAPVCFVPYDMSPYDMSPYVISRRIDPVPKAGAPTLIQGNG